MKRYILSAAKGIGSLLGLAALLAVSVGLGGFLGLFAGHVLFDSKLAMVSGAVVGAIAGLGALIGIQDEWLNGTVRS